MPRVRIGSTPTEPTIFSEIHEDGVDGVVGQMIPEGTSIGRSGKKGRSAGKWLRGVGNVGLALVRLEVMTDVRLPGETAAAAYEPDNEFVMAPKSGEEGDAAEGAPPVKIKAFVPEWLRRGLEA